MKTLGRILIIMIAFAVVMGVTYAAVSAGGSSTNAPVFQGGGAGFAPRGTHREFRDEGGGGGLGILFGLLKNTIIVAVIVALVANSKNFLQQQQRTVPARIK